VQHGAQRIGPELGEGAGRACGGEGEPVAQQGGEPRLGQVRAGASTSVKRAAIGLMSDRASSTSKTITDGEVAIGARGRSAVKGAVIARMARAVR
jgi:hypothetical protein